MATFERLAAWQACHTLWVAVHQATASWPGIERYVLTQQIRRAALSASCNVAEGCARHGPREFARFLSMALGSLAEVQCLLISARAVEVVKSNSFDELAGHREHAERVTTGLYLAMRRASSEK
jgi:four helix bundle protein